MIKCPRCESMDYEKKTAVSSAGWIMIILGLFLAVALIGIPMVIIGMCLKHNVYICKKCGRKF